MEVPNFIVVSGNPLEKDMPLLAIPVFTEDAEDVHSVLATAMRTLYRLSIIANWQKEFSGKLGEQLVLTPVPLERQGCAPWRILLVGLGRKNEVSVEKFRRAGGLVGKYAKEHKISNVAVSLTPSEYAEYKVLSQAYLEGTALGLYEYQHGGKNVPSYSITFFVEKQKHLSKKALSETSALVRAKYQARDWGNTPANLLTPKLFCEEARKLAASLGIETSCFGRAGMEQYGMGALLAVSKGSAEEPMFFHATYAPESYNSVKQPRKIVLVGKGVTFDAGGISLKPGLKMDEMKYDMCGAAAVVASMITVAQIQPNCEIHFVAPMTENLPDGNAAKPGDVITTMNGKTIEILNTDAEGRLILCDALTYVEQEIKPDGPDDIVLIFATLTGAVVMALGHDKTALYSNDDALAQKILATEAVTGEGLWRMPLVEEMKEDIKSKFADIANIGKSGEGGSIIGALTLSEFTGEGWKWAYGDIAGTAWGGRASIPYNPPGATGTMVGTIIEVVKGNQG